MFIYNVVRSLVTNAMVTALMFALAQPKIRKWTLWLCWWVL